MTTPRRRLFVPPDRLRPGSVQLAQEEARYATQVLRLTVGDPVELFSGDGLRARATVHQVRRGEVLCLADAPMPDAPSSGPAIHSGLPLLKGEHMDLAVRMLSELGVAAITLLDCERCVARSARLDRLQRIVQAASRQSGRSSLPRLAGPIPMQSFVMQAEGSLHFGDPTPRTAGTPEDSAPAMLPGHPVCICTGPEGGFTPGETEFLKTHDARPLWLGPHVLRAGTAAVTAVAVLRERLILVST